MFCQNCGAQVEEGLAFCTNCGAKLGGTEQQTQQTAQEKVQQFVEAGGLVSPVKVGFGDAIKLFFKNYKNFTGRSTVSEYWWAYLFNLLVSAVLGYIPVVGAILGIALMIPGIAVCVRRLHDTGKAWTYMLISLIPIVGAILLIIQLCKPSDADNQWGPAPSN